MTRASCAGLSAAIALAAITTTACDRSPANRDRRDVEVVVVYTTDEHGWILPVDERGVARGGAAGLLGELVAREGHCPGPVAPGGRAPPCSDSKTLLLSGGDNVTGPAVSTYFQGRPMALAMLRMGYAASAFGNHEFDAGREVFEANRAVSGVRYLAANMHGALPEGVSAHAIFERRGIRIAVVGLATDTTLSTAMASRFEGITFEREEPALERAIRAAWRDGPDVVGVIAHECPKKLEPIVERHPEWHLAFVGGGHCHTVANRRVAGVPIIAPGWRLRQYARIRVRVDRSNPPAERVRGVTVDLVDVRDDRATGNPDAVIVDIGKRYSAELDKALGERIGFCVEGIAKGSDAMGTWITTALRDDLGTDVAVINEGALRQAVPRGPITKASVFSVLPFDNKVVVCSLRGRDLVRILRHPDAVASGVDRTARGFSLRAKGPIAPDAMYEVATIDFLYYGGDHFDFMRMDPKPRETGVDWRQPIIAWTKRLESSESAPLEARLR